MLFVLYALCFVNDRIAYMLQSKVHEMPIMYDFLVQNQDLLHIG